MALDLGLAFIVIPNFSQNCAPLLLILNLFYVFKHTKVVCCVLCRNVTADGPAAAAEVCAVPDIRAPHRGVADCSETGRRDLAAALRDQPDSRSVTIHHWVVKNNSLPCCDFATENHIPHL